MSGPGRILRPTSGGNAPRPLATRNSGRAPYRFIRPMGARGCNQWVTHRYYSATGTEIWRADHGSNVRAIATASDGSVYTAGGEAHTTSTYKLAKWSRTGAMVWRIPVVTDIGYDVSCDSSGNIWLAAGSWLEKYTPSGTLLFTVSKVDDPWSVHNDGVTFFTLYFASIQRVLVNQNGIVMFGPSVTEIDESKLDLDRVREPELGANICDLDGNNITVAYPYTGGHTGVTSAEPTIIRHCFKDFDSDGNFYSGFTIDLPASLATQNFQHFGRVTSPDIYYSGVLRPPGVIPKLNVDIGFAQAELGVEPVSERHEAGIAAIAVHKSSGNVLAAWGHPDGSGIIKDVGDSMLVPALPYLNGRPNLVEESGAGRHGVLSVNANRRYIYSVDAVGATHRVRDYPNAFRWQADHKTTVRDAIIRDDNTVLIAGDRVFDDCVPVGLSAAAGCSNTGVVTVYEMDGGVRWSRTLLSTTSTNHDICFDGVGGIWARSGNGLQLVHTDPTGVIISDTAIGSIVSGSARPPTIDYTTGGLCYCNQDEPTADTPYRVAVGPSGALSTPTNGHLALRGIAITAVGTTIGWTDGVAIAWSAAGSILWTVNLLSIALQMSIVSAVAVSPVGDVMHVFGFSTFTGFVESGTVNLTTGVASSGGTTGLAAVNTAWCDPQGTVYYGATDVNRLIGSSYPTGLNKIDGWTNRVVVAANGVLDLWSVATGSTVRMWHKTVSAVSCAYFPG